MAASLTFPIAAGRLENPLPQREGSDRWLARLDYRAGRRFPTPTHTHIHDARELKPGDAISFGGDIPASLSPSGFRIPYRWAGLVIATTSDSVTVVRYQNEEQARAARGAWRVANAKKAPDWFDLADDEDETTVA